VAYFRVSTQRQGVSGLGLEAQQAAVRSYAAANGTEIIHAFEEVESGRKNARPQLEAALAACRAHGAALIVAKLDRLTRDTRFLLKIRDDTGDAGVVFCDLPQLPPGPIGKLFLTLLAAIGEFEAALISQRTKAALQAAKARGVKLGNPRLKAGDKASAQAAANAKRLQARRRAKELMPFIDAAQKAGCLTLGQLAEAMTARGIKTPGGGSNWTATTVRRAMQKAAG
jgi:DNA invertase Pin-like site-specific DNA recombinase